MVSPDGQEILLLGLSHRHAPVAVRQLCSVAPGDLPLYLKTLAARDPVRECWILSTCNRTEVLCVGPAPDLAVEAIKQDVFSGIGGSDAGYLYRYLGSETILHLFSVSAGLDSQVLGESEILRQMKQATQTAQVCGVLGPVLKALLRQAQEVGKRVRFETRLGEGTLSVARAGVDLARKIYGSFDRITALLVGAGETGLLVGRNLVEQGVRSLLIANRTLTRAQAAAEELGGDVVPLEDLRNAISRVNLVVVAVDSPEPVVLPEHFDRRALRTRDRPLLVLDLSVPRAVHPDVASDPPVLVQDLDALDDIVAHHQRQRRQEVEEARRIVVEESHKFLTLQTYALFKPVLSELPRRFQDVREAVLQELPEGCSREELARRLSKRLLDAAFKELKEGTRQAHSEAALHQGYRRYLERQ